MIITTMRNQKIISIIIAIAIVICFISCFQKKINSTAEYMNQLLPGDSAIIFAPNIISNGLINRDVAITPEGDEMYFGIASRSYAYICFSKRVDGRWTEPEIAPFSGNNMFYDFEPHISPDGKHFYFLSTRPKKEQEPKPGWVYQDIWVMDKTNSGWGEPYNIGEPVNTEDGEYYPSVTKFGKLYFTREAHNKNSIYRSKFENGKFQTVERVNIPVDSANIYNSFVSPDESYLIFCCSELKDKIGNTDYYISFQSKDNIWSKPLNMGNKVNRKGDFASSAFVTRDGKYLFFASNRIQLIQGKATFKNLVEMAGKPGNGSTDIYWIKADFIEKFRALSNQP